MPTPENKPWGWTVTQFADSKTEVKLCHIEKGGYSSVHRHNEKHNTFHVAQGQLQVLEFSCDLEGITGVAIRLADKVHVLTPDSLPLVMPAGTIHQFYAPEKCVLIEVYHGAGESGFADPGDIERFTKHGRSG